MGGGQKLRIDQVLEWLEKADYYQILNVPRDANSVVIKEAYFKLSKQYHPDRFFTAADPAAKEKISRVFKRLNEAYTVLKTSSKRTRYDKQLSAPQEERKIRYEKSEEDRSGPVSIESQAKTPNGKKYLKLAHMAQSKKDWKNVEMNLKFAVGFEPDNEFMKKMLEQARVEIAKLPKEDPYKIR